MDTTFLCFAVLGFLAVVLMLEALYLLWNNKHGRATKRVEERVRAMSASGSVSAEQLSILKGRMLSNSPWLTQVLAMMPRVNAVDRHLLQSGVGWSVGRLVSSMAFAAGIGWLIAFSLHLPGFVATAVVIVAGALPMLYVRRRRAKRILHLERQLPEAADLIARALRAGHAFPESIGMVADELPNPLGGEFRLAYDEISYGVSMNDALLNMVSRVPVDDLRYFVIAVLIQREAGGNLAEILGNISLIIRERLKLLGKIRVLSAEGRLSAWILGLLPFVVVGVLSLINPHFTDVFFDDPTGQAIALGGMVSMAFGVVWMRKIIRIHV
ncbi:tight adherence protein B [Pararobbsia alpina]|uniref:type II secretion system F family protein n=1 Tax=Pararobbsia alpina TaxID=621374 RepID=UPI0039A6DC2B